MDILSLDVANVKDFYENHKIGLLTTVGALTATYLLKRFYIAGGSCKSKRKLNGKTVIITGANTGIGKETALDLAERGARVILACRDVKKAMQAAEEIRKKSGNGNVIVEYLDLSSLKSVRNFANKINAQEDRVDILINNAAIIACPQWKTVDGFEMQFGTNHLGHFLLTIMLLDKMKKSAPSRIVNVSALAHELPFAQLNWNDLMSDSDYEPAKVYARTKLANVLFTRELAKRLQGTGVIANALHPGVVRTEAARHIGESYGRLVSVLMFITAPLKLLFFKSGKEGAQTTIYCAVDEALDNVSGKYFSDCKEKKLLPQALSDEDAEKLWKISEELINLKS